MSQKPIVFAALLLACGSSVLSAAEPQPLVPWPQNSWYWSYHGQPVLLLGGSDDDNLFQWPAPKLIPQLDRLVAAGGNVIRNTMSDRQDKGFEVYPFAKRPDGKYDLTQWNDEYWTRFERLLKETHSRSIVVQIEIWDRFDYTDNRDSKRWQKHPYHPANNCNYDFKESGFDKSYPDHPGQNKQPFFFTTPAQRDNQVVLPYQQRFVAKLLDHSLPYDHVLYCIDNETSGEEAWSRYWAEFLKQKAEEAGKRICVTEMWDDWKLTAERHRRTFDHPELYDYVDVSQNNHNKGQSHWDNFLHVRQYLRPTPRPMNTTKTYGATGNKFGHNDQDGIERFWRHLLAGAASMRFHRPDSGLGLSDKAVACIRAARKLESLVPLWTVSPANELLKDRSANEAYAAAAAGQAYTVYFPSGEARAEVAIDVTAAKGRLTGRWINIDTGEYGESSTWKGGSTIQVSPPDSGNWALALLSQTSADQP